jgi:hypothetical protein
MISSRVGHGFVFFIFQFIFLKFLLKEIYRIKYQSIKEVLLVFASFLFKGSFWVSLASSHSMSLNNMLVNLYLLILFLGKGDL